MQQTIQTNMSNDKLIANVLQANTSPINDNCMVVLILLDINGEKFKCIFFNKQTTTTEIINKSLSITTTARYTGMVEVYAKSKYEINIKTLSATGSIIAPNLEVTSNFLAIYPSRKSVVEAIKKIIKDKVKSPFKKNGINRNDNKILEMVMKLGRNLSINLCKSYLRI